MIEAKVGELQKQALPFKRLEVSRAEAMELFAQQPYKLERLADIAEDEVISIYSSGSFMDLCRGPHLTDTSEIGAIKLLAVAVLIFEAMNTIRCTARLRHHRSNARSFGATRLERLESAKLRDHRQIRARVGAHSINEAVGPGLAYIGIPKVTHQSGDEIIGGASILRQAMKWSFTPHVGSPPSGKLPGIWVFYRIVCFPA